MYFNDLQSRNGGLCPVWHWFTILKDSCQREPISLHFAGIDFAKHGRAVLLSAGYVVLGRHESWYIMVYHGHHGHVFLPWMSSTVDGLRLNSREANHSLALWATRLL